MLRRAMTHPLLADGSHIDIKRGKVTDKSKEETHESIFNMKAKTCDGWFLTFSYSRNKDGGIASGRTHAWVMFGKNCNSKQEHEIAMDFILNLMGFHARFCMPRVEIQQPMALPPRIEIQQPMALPLTRKDPKQEEKLQGHSDVSSGIYTECMGGESSEEERMALDEAAHMKAENDTAVWCPVCNMCVRLRALGDHMSCYKHRKRQKLYDMHGYGRRECDYPTEGGSSQGGSCSNQCQGCSNCQPQGASSSSK